MERLRAGRRIHACVVVLLSLVFLSACENPRFRARESGALGGAALGAGLGAIVGNQVGSTGAGIAIGSAFGALSGALVGNEIDNSNDAIDEQNRRIEDNDRQLEENRKIIESLKRQGFDVRRTSRGVVVNLTDVLFEFDRSNLTSSARSAVGDIARAINQNSNGRRISVEGHTDSVGTSTYNRRLSDARARSVAAELAHEGIPRSRMQVRGFGESQPVASNDTAAGRAKNRRVEVIIEN